MPVLFVCVFYDVILCVLVGWLCVFCLLFCLWRLCAYVFKCSCCACWIVFMCVLVCLCFCANCVYLRELCLVSMRLGMLVAWVIVFHVASGGFCLCVV